MFPGKLRWEEIAESSLISPSRSPIIEEVLTMRSGCLRYLGSRGSISRGREKYHQSVMTFKESVSGRTRKRGSRKAEAENPPI